MPEPADGEADRHDAGHGDSLESLILGESLELDAAQVAAETGVEVEDVSRLWRALGFPDPGEGAAFTRADAIALATMARAVETGLLDLDLAVNMTRGVGISLARLADWEVGALVTGLDSQGSGRELVAEFAQPFERLLVHAWRRHLAAAVARIEALRADEAGLLATEQTVGFADIVGFTALSNELPRERIGDLVELFETRCADVVSAQGGRLIKSIGDAVLFVNDDAVRGFETAEGIIAVVGRDPRMPDVRVGLATGSVVMRLGDVFGPSVNLASRLTAVARRNRIIVDAATAERLPKESFESRRLPARPVRGFGLVEPLTVRRP